MYISHCIKPFLKKCNVIKVYNLKARRKPETGSRSKKDCSTFLCFDIYSVSHTNPVADYYSFPFQLLIHGRQSPALVPRPRPFPAFHQAMEPIHRRTPPRILAKDLVSAIPSPTYYPGEGLYPRCDSPSRECHQVF